MTTLAIPAPSHPDQPLMPPHNPDAERATLGTMMLSADAFADVTDLLTEKDFYLPAHVAIFNAIVAVNRSSTLTGDFADVIRVSAELEDRHELRRVGGAPYLHTCLQYAISAANATYYAEMVAEKAQLRRLVTSGIRITQLGYDGAAIDDHGANPDNVARVVDRAQALLYEATTNPRAAGSSLVTADAAALEVLEQLDNPATRDLVTSGLLDLDNLIGGLEPGEFTVVAGRPGHGKTLLALSYTRETAFEQQKPTMFFSLEMSRSLLMQRILAAEASTMLDYITGKQPCSATVREKLQDTYERRIAPAPLYIDDSAYQTTATIRSAIRRFAQRHGVPALVVVDYLGLVSPTRSFERRDLEIAAMTRDFKIMAGELGTTFLVVHQLNRNSTQRADPHPQLADLRDGGSVEQDAFEVIWIYTAGVDDPTNFSGEATLGVAKNRQGVTGRVQVAWQAGLGRIGNLARP